LKDPDRFGQRADGPLPDPSFRLYPLFPVQIRLMVGLFTLMGRTPRMAECGREAARLGVHCDLDLRSFVELVLVASPHCLESSADQRREAPLVDSRPLRVGTRYRDPGHATQPSLWERHRDRARRHETTDRDGRQGVRPLRQRRQRTCPRCAHRYRSIRTTLRAVVGPWRLWAGSLSSVPRLARSSAPGPALRPRLSPTSSAYADDSWTPSVPSSPSPTRWRP
jgi:hypothetical protein